MIVADVTIGLRCCVDRVRCVDCAACSRIRRDACRSYLEVADSCRSMTLGCRRYDRSSMACRRYDRSSMLARVDRVACVDCLLARLVARRYDRSSMVADVTIGLRCLLLVSTSRLFDRCSTLRSVFCRRCVSCRLAVD